MPPLFDWWGSNLSDLRQSYLFTLKIGVGPRIRTPHKAMAYPIKMPSLYKEYSFKTILDCICFSKSWVTTNMAAAPIGFVAHLS